MVPPPDQPSCRSKRTATALRFVRAAIAGAMGAVASQGLAESTAPSAPDYNYEIRPILATHCFRCHGQDVKQRKGDLRLDLGEDAIKAGAITPGHLEKSELWTRITTADPEEVMPPPKEKKVLGTDEKKLLQRWIEAGAPYAKHWSFMAPETPKAPNSAAGVPWYRSPIDPFVFASLESKGFQPAAEATREEWLRRVTVDLTGLPPTLAEMDAFLADTSLKAHEKVVTRLLDSPAYGERMASDWLDVARYADTYGRHEDADCTTWPYRDWVIRAFNQNLPYSDFILWQTAGDLLPNPSQDQVIATCFNRLPQQSNEAGSNAEEFRVEQVSDRLRTNGLAFLGLSLECARCHDHKYDPITMKDYYSLAAMFNNIDELGLFCVYTGGVPPPSILLFPPDKESKFKAAKQRTAELEGKQRLILPEAKSRFAKWLTQEQPPMRKPEPGFLAKIAGFFSPPLPNAEPTKPLAHYKFESITEKKLINESAPNVPGSARLKAKIVDGREGKALEFNGDNELFINGTPEMKRCNALSYGLWVMPTQSIKRAVLAHRSRSGIDSASRGYELIIQDDRPEFALAHFSPGNEIRIRSREALPLNKWTHISVTYDGSSHSDGMRLFLNGLPANTEVVRDNLYRDIVYRVQWGDDPGGKDAVVETGMTIGGRHNDASFSHGLVDEFFFFDRELTAQEVKQWALLPDDSKPEDWLAWYLREKDEPWRELQQQLDAARAEENELSGEAVDLMVMKEWTGPRRPTHILNRGQFDQPREPVQPGVIESIFPFSKDLPQNRLGYAKWLLDRNHPLTSRVAVNRFWQVFFGRGIVLTSEDFGTQGQMPSNPQLLDWLATHFMDTGWDVKRLCREIVLSATYRQSAQPADPKLLADDPDNRLLARAPRQRLSAEQVRDLALSASGLLVPTIGGPSVKPYQPAGLWEDSGTQHDYVQDHGQKLYRRSMYTFWRRTMPPPTMTVFDAPTREFCKVRRESTTTPLQSLVLMNDPQLIEAARVLAEKLLSHHPSDPSARAKDAYRLLTSRAPGSEQLRVIESYCESERQRFEGAPDSIKALLTGNGEMPIAARLCSPDLAATTMMVRLLLGFSETTMKP